MTMSSGHGLCFEVSLPSGDSNLALHLLIVQLHLLQGDGQSIQLALHLLYLQCTVQGRRLHSFLYETKGYAGTEMKVLLGAIKAASVPLSSPGLLSQDSNKQGAYCCFGFPYLILTTCRKTSYQ